MARFDGRSRQRTAAAVAAVLCTVIFTISVPDALAAPTATATATTALRHAPECRSVRLVSARTMIVPVVVDTGGPTDSAEVACVTVPVGSNGAQVLTARAKQLGVPAPRYAESGLLCAIDGFPATGCGVQNGAHYAYWAYYHGGSSWTYASVGPASWKVSAGDVEGWRFQPEGSASPADPPPRAPSEAAILCPASTTTTTMAAPPPTTTTSPVPVSTTPGSSGGHSDPGSTPAPVTKGDGGKPSLPATTGPRPTSTTRPGTVPPSSTTAPPAPTPPGDVTVFGLSGSRSIGHLAAAHQKPGSKHGWVWISIALALIAVLGVAALMRTRLTKTE